MGACAPVSTIAAGVVIILVYGTAVHVVQLIASGFNPYPDLPGWMRIYFVSLTVLDPVAALLLARCTRPGVALATAVIVSDALANGWANYALDSSVGITAGRIGHAVITLIAIGICTATRRLWRCA